MPLNAGINLIAKMQNNESFVNDTSKVVSKLRKYKPAITIKNNKISSRIILGNLFIK